MIRHMTKRYWRLEDVKEFASVSSKFKILYASQPTLFQSIITGMKGEVGYSLLKGFLRYTVDENGLNVRDTLNRNVLFMTEKGIYVGRLVKENRQVLIHVLDEMRCTDFKSVSDMMILWDELKLMSGIRDGKFK